MRRVTSTLALLAVAELLGMSPWFAASAVSPQLRELWGLSASQAGWLTGAVQLGFVAGTLCAAVFNLADVLPARAYFAAAAAGAAAANLGVAVAPGLDPALGLRFLTGVFLAGVYPPAMKMATTWHRSGRGLAIGVIVGALTVGKALPWLADALGGADWRIAVFATSAAAAAAAVLVGLGYRDGPYPFPLRPFSWSLVATVARVREIRLATAGYLGHMWELYAMWTLVALFFADLLAARGLGEGPLAPLIGFAVIGVGGAGAVAAGVWADRFGRERTTVWSMAVSGACSLLVGWLTAAPLGVVLAVALVWGFAIVADSAQFSAVVTEVAPPHAVGTALTLQTSLGFALTAGSIWLATEVSSRIGWGPAFSLLAAGPALGIVAMARLRRLRSAVRRDGGRVPAHPAPE